MSIGCRLAANPARRRRRHSRRSRHALGVAPSLPRVHPCPACTAATSPLYSYQAVFSAAPGQQEVISAASLFFWTLTLIVLIK